MLKTFIAVCCLVLAAVTAGELDGAGLLYHNYNAEYAPTYHNYEPRDYHFEYGVSDPHTGDHKSQWETKDKAGVVRGGYSLLEPDGTTRIVEYIADDHGFRAVVKKLGNAIHPTHVETTHHGHVEAAIPAQSHVQIATQLEPIAPTPAYHAYNGQVDNYANILETPHEQPQYILSPKFEGIPAQSHVQLESGIPAQSHIQLESGIPAQSHIQLESGIPAQSHVQLESVGPILTQKTEGIYGETGIPAQSHIQIGSNLESVLTPKAEGIYGQGIQTDLSGPYGQNVLTPTAQGLYQQHGIQNYESQDEPRIYFGENQGVIHPHGESSQQYHGITGNPDDDSAYTNYEDSNHREFKALPYNFVISHPILH